MRAIVITPDGKIETKEIANWDEIKAAMGDDDTFLEPIGFDAWTGYVDEDGIAKRLPPNQVATRIVVKALADLDRSLMWGDYIKGTIVFLGTKEGDDGFVDCDLPQDVIDKYFGPQPEESTVKLTAGRVDAIFQDCLLRPGEALDACVVGLGVLASYGFDRERLERHRTEIWQLLQELPDKFKHQHGNEGASFLDACYDRHDNQWGEHKNMEQLFALGLATKLVVSMYPKPLWRLLPGGMPYFRIRVRQPEPGELAPAAQ